MIEKLTGFAGALAVIGSAAYVSIAIAGLLGSASRPDLARTAVVAVVLVVAIALPRPTGTGWRPGSWAGIALGLLGLVGADLVAGDGSVGAGQIGGLIGAAVTLPVLGRAWSDEGFPRLLEIGFLVVFSLVTVALVRSILDGGALGHDESAYALKARAWIAATPETGWQLHRAPLNSVAAIPVVWFTESEVALRIVAAALAVGSLAAVGIVASRLGGRWAGFVAVATVGASLSYLRRGSEFLTDVPAAGLLLVVVWLVLQIVESPDESKSLLWWLAAAVVAAFYMRYQSSLAIVGIVVGSLVAWPEVVSRLRKSLAWATGLVLAALVPHLIWATVVTGRPWGVVLQTGDAAGREFLGEGLVDYLRMFPLDLAGPVGAIMAIAGIGWLLRRSAARLRGSRDLLNSFALFALIIVVVSVVPLGLVAHGEPRFVFFPMWLLIGCGSVALVGLGQRLHQPYQAVAVSLAALLWLPLFVETADRVDRNAERRGETFAVLADASNSIEHDGHGTCAVLTTYRPQVTWYSACSSELLKLDGDSIGVELLDADREYVLLFENGKRQPADEVIIEHLDLSGAQTVPDLNDGIGDATIVEISED